MTGGAAVAGVLQGDPRGKGMPQALATPCCRRQPPAGSRADGSWSREREREGGVFPQMFERGLGFFVCLLIPKKYKTAQSQNECGSAPAQL